MRRPARRYLQRTSDEHRPSVQFPGRHSATNSAMMRSMTEGRQSRVFVSYRRDDCAIHAGRLADNLRDRAGAEVFLDIDTIGLGENFLKRIEREITSCDV